MIRNFIMFIGQVVRGATAGAPLSVSSTGLLSSGLSVTRDSATTSTTTTSATDVLMNLMTRTPAAGTYYVTFRTSLDVNSNNAIVRISVWSGGSQVADSEGSCQPYIQGGLTPSLPVRQMGFVDAVVTVNGSQAIEGRWRTSGGTATAQQRSLTIMRIS